MDERNNVNVQSQEDIVKALAKLILGENEIANKMADLLVPCKDCPLEQRIKELAKNDKEAKILVELIRKISAELNTQNNSTFEDLMGKLGDLVDIDKGVKELLSLSLESTDEEKESAKIKTGLDYVIRRIQHYLVESKITSNILVEYSLLSSTLDPDNPDKLQCCSFIIGDKPFVECVDNNYTSCINYTADIEKGIGLSIYQHPHFLYNIPIREKRYLFNSDLGVDDDTQTRVISNGKGLTISIKKSKISKDPSTDKIIQGDKYSINDSDKNGGNFKKIGISDIFIDAFTLDRPFKEMLLRAKKYNVVCEPTLEMVQNKLHSFCHKNITCDDSRVINNEEKTSVYVSFPIYGSRASNQLPQYEIINNDGVTALQGIGACFIYFEPSPMCSSSPIFNKLVEQIIEKIVYEIGKFVRFVSANYMFNLGLQLQENARKEALKSARSAIMSRNMSHNLGSHVMSYLKQHLSSVQNVLNDRILALLFENEADMLDNLSENLKAEITSKTSEKGALPFLVGLGQFISYLQERQDFIATIATDFIPYLSTVNFKDFIYDELNPDKRYERHKDRKNFKTDNILLGNIARSEGLGRPTSPTITLSKTDKNSIKEESKLNDIVIKFRSFDGNPVKDTNGNITNQTGNDALLHMRDYDLSLPGGVVGRQAIFSIVENTIRNAAKHGNWRDKGKLELTFDIYTKEELLKYNNILQLENEVGQNNCNFEKIKQQIECEKKRLNTTHQGIISTLCDTVNGLSLWEVFEKFYLNAKDSDALYFITLTDNLSTDENKLEKLRIAIKEPLINERGIMNEGSKGIKEMRISAAWLRGIAEGDAYNPITFKDENNAKLKNEKDWVKISKEQYVPALYARIAGKTTDEAEGHLQYIFCALRPKKVAIISSKFPKHDESQTLNLNELYNKDAFIRNSWSAIHPEDYIKEKNKSYEFIIYDEPENEEESYWLDLRCVSSSRLYKLNELPLRENLFENIKKCFGEEEEGLMAEKRLYNEMLCSLYGHIANYVENEDFILIDDKKAEARKNNSQKEFKPFKAITIIDGQFDEEEDIKTTEGNWFVYRTHHDSAEEFKKFIEEQDGKVFKRGVYVEGITGNNSTDRLVRNESLNEEWFYRHLHAMKDSVAIFDERIFTKVFGLEEADLVSYDTDWPTLEKDLADRYFKDCQIENDYEKQDDLMADPQWHDMLKEKYPKEVAAKTLIQSIDYVNAKSGYVPTTYTQKGIFIFTIVRDPKDSSIFNLYGVKRSEKDGTIFDSDVSNTYISVCQKIATLNWNSTGLHVIWLDKFDIFFKDKFNHISIHQGLLDKLYTVFGIKDKNELKEKLTQKFYEEFSLQKSVKVKEEFRMDKIRIKEVPNDENEINSFYLLPGMCIHSGRSKPSIIDMPQRLPFIQYASIENAVSDCKYSLIELLDYARYE